MTFLESPPQITSLSTKFPLSPLLKGSEIEFPYSRNGLTMDLYSRGSVNSSTLANERRTAASIREAFDVAAAVCLWKFSCLSMTIPRSFSSFSCRWPQLVICSGSTGALGWGGRYAWRWKLRWRGGATPPTISWEHPCLAEDPHCPLAPCSRA